MAQLSQAIRVVLILCMTIPLVGCYVQMGSSTVIFSSDSR